MSGDMPCTIKAIWECPFCGQPTRRIESRDADSFGEDGITKYDDDSFVKELILRIECISDSDCPAMDESGAYWLHIYPDGSCHAYYY